jgi:iron complex transport system permease protein
VTSIAADAAVRGRARLPWIGLAIAVLLLLALGALCLGRYPIAPSRVLALLLEGPAGRAADPAQAIVWQIRLPRVGVAALVGAALSGAGAAYQQLFRNPLVSPDTLGVSSGAALGAVLAILAGAGFVALQLAAFAGGLIAVAVVMLIAARLTAHDALVTLILTGVVVASLLGAGISLTKYVADPYNELPAITYWLMGSFAASTWRELAAIVAPVAL